MDINAISQLAGATAPAPIASAAPAAPDDLAVDRFSQALGTPAASGPADPAATPARPDHVPTTLGESILAGLDDWSARMRSSWSAVHEPLGTAGQMTSARLIDYQVKLMDFQVSFELYSKGVSKSVQDLENSLKTQ